MNEFINSNVRFTDGMTAATKEFARSKPFQGTVAERAEKFQAYHDAVMAENELENVSLIVAEDTVTDESGASGISRVVHLDEAGLPTDEETNNRAIFLAGKLSVVTYLYLVGVLLGYGRRQAMEFAVNLFAKRFPRSFAACYTQHGMIRR